MHPDAHAQILMSGVGTFINLMEEEEEEAFEKRKGDFMKGHDILTEMSSRFRMMRSNLQGAVKKAELVVANADMEVKAVPRYAESWERGEPGNERASERARRARERARRARERVNSMADPIARWFNWASERIGPA
jgi:hypothetical protein